MEESVLMKKSLKLNSNNNCFTINIIVQNKAAILLEYLKHNKTNFNVIFHKKNLFIKKKINKKNINKIFFLNFKNNKEFSDQLFKIFKQKKNSYFLNMANFIFLNPFLKTFKKKIINFHPSYLPEHKGLNAFEKAYYSDLKSGASVHFVNKNIDGGKIILRKRYLINKNKSFKFNRNEIFKIQFKQFSKIVKKINDSKI